MMIRDNRKFSITVVLLLICFIVSSIMLIVANKQFTASLRDVGGEIPQKIKATQENYIRRNDGLLRAIASELYKIEKAHNSISVEQMNESINNYGEILEIDNIKMYAVINDTFYRFNNAEDVQDYTKTEWYEKAKNAKQGEIIYTNSHQHNETGEILITAAMKIEDTDDILAINIFPQRIATWSDIDIFPNGAAFYIADSNGKIIHQGNSNIEQSKEDNKETLTEICNEMGISEEKLNSLEIAENEEKSTGIYSTETYNGWKIVVTIPYAEMLAGTRTILIAYYTTTVVFAMISIYLLTAERNALKGKSLYNRITKALGDFYYAIYLVDFEKSKYTILKCTGDMEKNLPKKGDYNDFLKFTEVTMEKEAYEEFKDTFSIKNIQKLVKSNVRNFGGDFKRTFNNGFKWVNVQMLYSEESVKRNKPEIMLAFQDVSKRKEKEIEEKEVLKESIETMRLSTQTKNRFFANMSHDMRTPLNAIINFSNMAKNQIDNQDRLLDYLNKIHISSKQLLELINDILDVSKIEENMPLIDKAEFNITKALEDTLLVFKEQAELQKKQIKIDLNIKNNYVLSDWGKIRQIVSNIMSNALKYTKTDGKISVEINEIEGKFISKYEFRIIDNGIGMSKEFLRKIYTPFERETRFHSEEMTGTGLGMAIVQNNIQKLNGQITINSKPGKGSEFYIVLPLEIGQGAQNESDTDEQEIVKDLTGKRILVVEDNELNMEISTEILEMQGVKITQARDGMQAVDIFKNSVEGCFDAILMDIQMPIMDGYEATRTIRSLPRKDAKDVVILAVTANAFAEDIIEAEKAGMNDYISKPIDFKELQKVLTKFI